MQIRIGLGAWAYFSLFMYDAHWVMRVVCCILFPLLASADYLSEMALGKFVWKCLLQNKMPVNSRGNHNFFGCWMLPSMNSSTSAMRWIWCLPHQDWSRYVRGDVNRVYKWSTIHLTHFCMTHVRISRFVGQHEIVCNPWLFFSMR